MTEQDQQISPALRFTAGADIHSHILPGIDDGANSVDESLLMALIAARNGSTLMVATPHRYWQRGENRPEALRALTRTVQAALATTRFGKRFQLLPGQEIPLTLETAEELCAGTVLTLGDNGVYALVEPAFEHLPDWTVEAITSIVAAGFRPVLAHPERNAVVKTRPSLASDFVAAGARLQLTAMSITGENGEGARAAAHWILDHGLAAAIASDCHSPTWRPPTLRAAFHTVRARYGLEVARRLCCDNPRAIALGEETYA